VLVEVSRGGAVVLRADVAMLSDVLVGAAQRVAVTNALIRIARRTDRTTQQYAILTCLDGFHHPAIQACTQQTLVEVRRTTSQG
jgi:hypothetical protein